MKQSIRERLRAGDVLLFDGAMGTMLFGSGLKPGECPEILNLNQPEVIANIARRYHAAGADIINANTFGGSPMKLQQYDLDARIEEINRAAVRAAREAVGDNAYIAGSVGPSGEILKPYGEADPEDLLKGFTVQIKTLTEAGVDLILIETMTDINEAKIAIEAASTVTTEVPIAATMTFDPTPKGFYTVMGVNIETAARELTSAGADIVGSNCGNGSENMVKIAEGFREHTDLPILIQSNAGLPETRNDQLLYPETPEFMAERVERMLDLGVSIVGGCCGTTPDHIRAFREVISARENI